MMRFIYRVLSSLIVVVACPIIAVLVLVLGLISIWKPVKPAVKTGYVPPVKDDTAQEPMTRDPRLTSPDNDWGEIDWGKVAICDPKKGGNA